MTVLLHGNEGTGCDTGGAPATSWGYASPLASAVEGGVSHHLTKGDVITIPAKTPHQWKDTSKTGSVGHYAVNFDSN